jgi:hypothetical protein
MPYQPLRKMMQTKTKTNHPQPTQQSLRRQSARAVTSSGSTSWVAQGATLTLQPQQMQEQIQQS